MKSSKILSPTDEKDFFSKGKASDVRLGDVFFRLEARTLEEFTEQTGQETDDGSSCLLLGHLDDKKADVDGVKFSTKKSASKIRTDLYHLNPPYMVEDKQRLIDCGSLVVEEDKSETLAQLIAQGSRSGHRWLTLGGKTPRTFAEIQGWVTACEESSSKRPLLICLTANLAMSEEDEINEDSIHWHLSQLSPLDLLVVGAHVGHFSKEHRVSYLENSHCRMLDLENLQSSSESIFDQMLNLSEDWLIRQRPVWLCIDMSVFGSSVAGSYPLSRPLGLEVGSVTKVLSILHQRQSIQGLSIVNVDSQSPVSVAMASELAYRFLYHL